MNEIVYIDRISQKEEIEQVYGAKFIELMYGKGFLSSIAKFCLTPAVCGSAIFSHLYGFLQKSSFSQRKILPFIETFQMDSSEFLDSVDSYRSFNEFFIRKLKPQARPICLDNATAILPADARYLVYENISMTDGFLVKGKKFQLQELLQNPTLAKKYESGSMVIARLCPTDYHRFHFPFDCFAHPTTLINGSLFSVNPLALRKNIDIFTENKRTITLLDTDLFGQVAFLEIGATCVGEIHQTFQPNTSYKKGEEKGYFSFGGSSLILLFEPNQIRLDKDLITASQKRIEVKGLFGQSLGQSITASK